MIALYADECVDAHIVEGLRRRGIDVLTAREAGLTGRVDDARHLQLATERGRVLLSGDQDLLGVARAWTAAGKTHAGLIYFHPRRTTVGIVVRDVAARAAMLSADDARDTVFYVARDRKAER